VRNGKWERGRSGRPAEVWEPKRSGKVGGGNKGREKKRAI